MSIKTVSRVLNHEPHVREATRNRVLAAVAKLNYTPNISARALAGARSYLLCLYIDNPSPGYVAQVEQGAMSACRRNGCHLIVEELQPNDPGLRERILAQHATVPMDGVLLTPPLCDNPTMLDALDSARTPYVRIAPSHQVERSAYVYMDDRRAGYEMTAYLQSLGHTDIAFIAGPSDHVAAGQRREGFLEAMRDAGFEPAPSRLQHGAFSFRSGWDCGERLLSRPDRPTAVFVGNDDMALGVMAVANRLHLEVPEQVTIVGFDDSPSAQVVWPQLTTVRQPVAEMAKVAAELLIARSADGEGRPARRMEFEVIVRDSSGPVRRP